VFELNPTIGALDLGLVVMVSLRAAGLGSK
jgi:hypothetical protein